MKETKKGKLGAIILVGIIIIGLILLAMCAKKIPAGYVGVVYNMSGGVEDRVLTQGWKLVAPHKKVTRYTIGMEQATLTLVEGNKEKNNVDERFKIMTSDGKPVVVSLEFSFRYDAERVPEIFTTFKGQSGDDIRVSFIKPKVIAWTQEVGARYPVTDVFGDQRANINYEIQEHLQYKFAPYGILIETVNLTDTQVDEETLRAIQRKVTAQQELELARIEAMTAEVQANKDKEVALIAAETKIIQAEAEAEANRIIATSLTSQLIEKIKYEKWDGELPMVQGDGSAIVDLRN